MDPKNPNKLIACMWEHKGIHGFSNLVDQAVDFTSPLMVGKIGQKN